MNWWIGFMTLTSKFEDNVIVIEIVISLIRLENFPHLCWTGRGNVLCDSDFVFSILCISWYGEIRVILQCMSTPRIICGREEEILALYLLTSILHHRQGVYSPGNIKCWKNLNIIVLIKILKIQIWTKPYFNFVRVTFNFEFEVRFKKQALIDMIWRSG